jgi:hypothetical protein
VARAVNNSSETLVPCGLLSLYNKRSVSAEFCRAETM